ncbi:YhgN family NAAT transporter [Pelagibaculum spongiae]|uniref:UPF0056 membrane protein n=1 Tax=Pelagibaculum spongiae TaxID=2080658 RepID=A0A2V1GZT0_9GAMM|nr:YhgN family NAAT transporter [Pelagibaculum spongiae]PVZ68841.1 Marc family transporter [Pelagibaculum spongiae]
MDIFAAAVTLFLILDPLGNIPVFLSILKDLPEERRCKVLLRELFISLAILLLFLFSGQWVLEFLGLRQETVSIAGGIILLMIAIRMVFPPVEGGIMGDTPEGEPFIVPLAVPMISGPSILATLILMANQYPGKHMELTIALLMAWGATTIILLSSAMLNRFLGERGLIALERLMGMILVMLGVQMFLDGLAVYLHLV